jgi:ubiquinone/menaquinone biosynthesis C-methylase UbiE
VSELTKTLVKQQFGVSSRAYATSDVHARGESLDILLAEIRPRSDWVALDVATGAGHTALAVAPHVKRVVAYDLTEQMLETAADLAARRGLANFETRLGDAEALPFPDGSFDLVTCRLAFHHFPDSARAFAEMARVLRSGGTLGFTDNYVVDDPEAAAFYNEYERLRDPSHVRVLALGELEALFTRSGLAITALHRLEKEMEFQDWADRQHVSAADKERLLEMARHVPAALVPLLAPRWADGTMYFTLWEAAIVATKGA